jgi:hypothetical protein
MSETVMSETVTLKQHFDERFNAADRAIKTLEAATNQRCATLEASTNERFHAVNELRGMANDIAQRGLPRSEFTLAHATLEQKVNATQKLAWVGLGIMMAFQVAVAIWLSAMRHT